MKLVIDISETVYNLLNSDKQIDWLGAETILEIVAKGTPYEERPKGKWIIHNDYNENCRYGCDQCGNLTNRNSSFCPNCGARMESDV